MLEEVHCRLQAQRAPVEQPLFSLMHSPRKTPWDCRCPVLTRAVQQQCTKDKIVELSHNPVLVSVVRALLRPIGLNDSVQAAMISYPVRTILLAEDDAMSLALLMRPASFGDNRCTATTNGREAVEA